jgi:hypothetical protein
MAAYGIDVILKCVGIGAEQSDKKTNGNQDTKPRRLIQNYRQDVC